MCLSVTSVWQHRGETRDANGLWRSHKGHMIAPTPLLTILISDVHGFDHCARGEVIKFLKNKASRLLVALFTGNGG